VSEDRWPDAVSRFGFALGLLRGSAPPLYLNLNLGLNLGQSTIDNLESTPA
jgi:hypothetical protein